MTSMYPALLFQINNPVHLTQCCTFCPAPATKFTLFDDLAAVNAAHFCEECFEELHGADMERCNRDWFVYDAVSAVQGLAHIVDRVRALGGTVEK